MIDDSTKATIRDLRAQNVSVNDIMRQTGASKFEVHEITEGRDAAISKVARLHYLRGTGWPWDREDNVLEVPRRPSGDMGEDAAQGVVDLLRGTRLDDPVRKHLDALTTQGRRQMIDLIAEIIRISAKNVPTGSER